VRGREAIARMWQAVIDSGVKGVTLTTLEVEAAGDIACEVGTYRLTGDGGTVLDAGKYVVVWKKEDGAWKLHRDIWNSSVPSAKG
jgi:ketosteroid isomerase-like protein